MQNIPWLGPPRRPGHSTSWCCHIHYNLIWCTDHYDMWNGSCRPFLCPISNRQELCQRFTISRIFLNLLYLHLLFCFHFHFISPKPFYLSIFFLIKKNLEQYSTSRKLCSRLIRENGQVKYPTISTSACNKDINFKTVFFNFPCSTFKEAALASYFRFLLKKNFVNNRWLIHGLNAQNNRFVLMIVVWL